MKKGMEESYIEDLALTTMRRQRSISSSLPGGSSTNHTISLPATNADDSYEFDYSSTFTTEAAPTAPRAVTWLRRNLIQWSHA